MHGPSQAASSFPAVFSYIAFQILKSGVLFLTYRYYEENYFDAYWTGNAISVILAVAVMDEMLQHVFKEYGGAQNLGSVIFAGLADSCSYWRL